MAVANKKKKASDAPGPKSVIESNIPTPTNAPAATARTLLGACAHTLRAARRLLPAEERRTATTKMRASVLANNASHAIECWHALAEKASRSAVRARGRL